MIHVANSSSCFASSSSHTGRKAGGIKMRGSSTPTPSSVLAAVSRPSAESRSINRTKATQMSPLINKAPTPRITEPTGRSSCRSRSPVITKNAAATPIQMRMGIDKTISAIGCLLRVCACFRARKELMHSNSSARLLPLVWSGARLLRSISTRFARPRERSERREP